MSARVRLVCDRCGWKPPRRGWGDARALERCPSPGCPGGVLVVPLHLRLLGAAQRSGARVAFRMALERIAALGHVQSMRIKSVERQKLTARGADFARLDALLEGLRIGRDELRELELELDRLEVGR